MIDFGTCYHLQNKGRKYSNEIYMKYSHKFISTFLVDNFMIFFLLIGSNLNHSRIICACRTMVTDYPPMKLEKPGKALQLLCRNPL